MKKYNLQNERIKRRYLAWIRDAEGLSPSTIDQIVRAISLWEEHTKAQDFQIFNSGMVKAFKEALLKRINATTKQPWSIITIHHHLMHLAAFYKWLSAQQGYKSKIAATDAAYFQLDRKQTRIALHQPKRRIPTLEIIKRVITSIKIENEIDRRDQALMAFAFLSGMRIDAIISLPLKCADIDKMSISQNPAEGVRTKYTKAIPTTIFNFDGDLTAIVKAWPSFLRKEKLFTDNDPLFPATITEQESPNNYAFAADGFGTKFWKSTNSARVIFKKRFEAAGLPYFNPHSFRHAAIKIAMSLCDTASDLKAVSQNLGHDSVSTTMRNYASLSDDEVETKIRNLTEKVSDAELEAAKRFLKDFNVKPKN